MNETANKMKPCLWVENNLDEVFAYYKGIFKENFAELFKAGISGEVAIFGQHLQFLQGGPLYKFNEAVSFVITCEDQAEVDYYWNALTADGGKEGQCAWCKDKYGLSWQIVPKQLYALLSNADAGVRDYAMKHMLTMKKIVIKDLEK
jgi:predicted 3-demethylubiquinone-9 3-methyltransferase (glyoxalase superfamily)